MAAAEVALGIGGRRDDASSGVAQHRAGGLGSLGDAPRRVLPRGVEVIGDPAGVPFAEHPSFDGLLVGVADVEEMQDHPDRLGRPSLGSVSGAERVGGFVRGALVFVRSGESVDGWGHESVIGSGGFATGDVAVGAEAAGEAGGADLVDRVAGVESVERGGESVVGTEGGDDRVGDVHRGHTLGFGRCVRGGLARLPVGRARIATAHSGDENDHGGHGHQRRPRCPPPVPGAAHVRPPASASAMDPTTAGCEEAKAPKARGARA